MISETLLRLGPFIVPALLVIFAALLCLVVWLLQEPPLPVDYQGKVIGPRPPRRPWRVGLACLILGYLALQIASLVLS